MKPRFFLALLLAGLAPIATLSCSNTQENPESVVFMTASVDSVDICTEWDLINIPTIESFTVTSHLKKEVADTRFLDIELQDMWITWRRVDGGTRIPEPYHVNYDFLLPAGGTFTFSNGPILALEQIRAVPFDVLLPENGGLDPETGNSVIRLEATLTVYGRTLNGDRLSADLVTIQSFRYGIGCA